MRKKARQEVEKKIGRVYGGQAHNKQRKNIFLVLFNRCSLSYLLLC